MIQKKTGDCREILKELPDQCANQILTSPPYWPQINLPVDDNKIGQEDTSDIYVENLVAVFREARRVLINTGTFFLVHGDTFCSIGEDQEKGVSFKLASALQDDGWILRSTIIWGKINPFIEKVTDRPTNVFDYIFMFVKQPLHYFNRDFIQKGNFWPMPANQDKGVDFVRFPKDLVIGCIEAGCVPTGTVLDPFSGSCIVGEIAEAMGRSAILIDIKEEK